MRGDIVYLSSVKMTDRWSRCLTEMGVSKVGVYRSGGAVVGHPLSEFIKQIPDGTIPYESALVAPLGFRNRPLGMLFRNTATKDFKVVPFYTGRLSFYASEGFEKHKDKFVPGAPIVLLEGVLDTEAFVSMTGYPFAIAYLTSYVGSLLSAFVASMTDKVILIPDNDQSGRRGGEQTLKNFRGYDVKVKVMTTELKDFGDVYDAKSQLEVEKARYLLCSF